MQERSPGVAAWGHQPHGERGEELDDMRVDVLTENHALETDCVGIQNVHVLGLREATRHLNRTEAVASVAALGIVDQTDEQLHDVAVDTIGAGSTAVRREPGRDRGQAAHSAQETTA